MERKALTEIPGVDLSAPGNLPKRNKTQCLGNKWNPTHPACKECQANFICAAMYKSKLDKKVKKIESKELFLDQLDFELFDWEGLEGRTGIKESVNVQEVINEVCKTCFCASPKLALVKIKLWCKLNSRVIVEDQIRLQ